ncbi:MAG: type VII secretion protein EssC [Bacilli bacterium]|nr:type VII secretion protein EssC [Bacilli bacterium]
MIIYVLNNSFLNKYTLPIEVDGAYSLYAHEKQFVANVEEKNGKWVLTLNQNIVFMSDEITEVKEYSRCIVKDAITGEVYFIYALPLYDKNTIKCLAFTDTIVIGKSSNADIFYGDSTIPEAEITLKYTNDHWVLNTILENIFVSDKRVKQAILKNGDYIFCYGLKIIVIDKLFIISNPDNLVKIQPTSFRAYVPPTEVEGATYAANIQEDLPLFDKSSYFFKAPRFDSVLQEEIVKVDEPPAPIKPNDTPVLLQIGPQLTMISISVFSIINYITMYLSGSTTTSRFIISLCTIIITMVSAFLWPMLTRNFNKKRSIKAENKRQIKYKEYLDAKTKEILLIQNKQKQIINEMLVAPGNCKLIIDSMDRKLWQRGVEHDDFLEVRLGIGNVPTKIKITLPEEKFSVDGDDQLLLAMKQLVNQSLIIPNVPLGVNLTTNSISAVVGKNYLTKNVIDNIFLQIMTFHSYTELKIVIFTDDANKWDYLKILPHCWNNPKTIRYFATNSEEVSVVAGDLEKEFDERVIESKKIVEGEDGEEEIRDVYKTFKPYYLVFTDNIESVRNVPLIKKILKHKKNMGFSLLMLNEQLSTLPSETKTFINIGDQVSGLITNELNTNNQSQFVADGNGGIDLYDCAVKLANIPIHIEKAKYELPSSLSFLEMYGVGKVEQLNCRERWKNNNPVNTLAVPIGIDQNGEIFKMDIHEKAYGPHGLVAGTTGSGKSEWIITFILSLAVNYHPDEVQFVLIDYKGGGLALSFENSEMGIKLPHLAGTITNLDKSEINRSIASIESELKRRQSIFNEAREKLKESSMNIYKYQQFYRKGMVDIPLSHLLIICDEFAELKQQQPEFMEQLISTSRIGRSLGVHLILATQKPSGVVNDQIWSNSKFKVCLKVQDKGDSNEILKKPDAAYLKQTGAFYLSVGNDDYYNLGQSAWAGAKYYPSDILLRKVDQSIQHIDNIGRTISNYDFEVPAEKKVASQGEELLNIIKYINDISKKELVYGNQLWLPNVKPVSYLSDLVSRYGHKYSRMNFTTPIGEYDEPRQQKQGLLTIDLAEGNIGIVGQTGSGKEMLLSTIIWSSIIEHTPQEINYYIIDFGAETLKKFAKFPHVGEVVFQDDMSRVLGVMGIILEELERRKELFSEYDGSFTMYNKMSGSEVPLINVVINGFDVFQEAIPKFVDIITNLFRDAPRYGIVFIVSASTNGAIRSRQVQHFNHMIVLQMQDEGSYRAMTNCRRGLMPSRFVGRGICKIGHDDDSYCEFQTASIVPKEQEYAYIKSVAEQLVQHYNYKAKQLAQIPDNVTSEDLTSLITDITSVPIGYNFYEKDVAKYDFSGSKVLLVTGKDIKKNVPFLYGLASIFTKMQNSSVRIVDMLGIFNKPILDIKLFKEDFDPVIAALENDVLTRNETQGMGINIIIGAGQFKKKLKKAGVEIFNNMINNIPASKQNLFILIDDYDKLRTLKLEPWFNSFDTTRGIWLGPGFHSQSLLSSNEVSAEDKKYDYAGLAYTITNGEYTVIKTVMDGDD